MAILIVLVIAGFFALRIWADDLTKLAFVPTAEFVQQPPLQANAYHDPGMWFSRPGMGPTDSAGFADGDPARWQPAFAKVDATTQPALGAAGATDAGPGETPPKFAVFFVHPTSYVGRNYWNAPLDDADANSRARLFIRGMASPFNQASEIWAPRYRQAAFGSFLTQDPKADQAIDAAYKDIEQAFAFFVDSIDPAAPIVLAGHSQGSMHLLRLMANRVAGTPLQSRIAMVYAIGWPISLEHDLPRLGMPACATAEQSGCVVSWVSFAEPAEIGQMLERYNSSPGLDGQTRTGSPILCTNPITGTMNGTAPAQDNPGTLVPNADLTSGELVVGAVPARCDAQGILLIGDPPELGFAVLPGNNYHVYDIPLFWQSLQQDVVRRVKAWQTPR
ncbi:MAG: DUF3089 domain-containing protein [Proteobacteria bacterium]|nr:MAG: DUF3089 domain-containing protein [Pseudomonadota bacterium]